MESIDLRAVLIVRLYEAYFSDDQSVNLKTFKDTLSIEGTTYWNLVNRLKQEGLIKDVAMGGWYEITPNGVIVAEQGEHISKDLLAKNENARTKILVRLAKTYKEQGNQYHTQKAMLCSDCELEDETVSRNLQVLKGLGYVETSGNMGWKLTYHGLEAVENYESGKSVADSFEAVKNETPQRRGRELQKILAAAIEKHSNGWTQEEGVRTSNEEMDVIVSRDREYYLLESKWEKDPVEADIVRELFGKLGNRIDVRGILASMSGFTSGAVSQAESYIGQKVVLFFGPEDIQALIYGKADFESLLNAKYKELVTRRKIIVS